MRTVNRIFDIRVIPESGHVTTALLAVNVHCLGEILFWRWSRGYRRRNIIS